jgi:AraC-like DNA-binding protein
MAVSYGRESLPAVTKRDRKIDRAGQGGLITVSVRSIRPAVARLGRLGVDVASLLSAVGVDHALLDDSDARLPHSLLLAIWDEAVARSGDDAFGIHVAEEVRPGAFDVLDYGIRSSATLGEGFERLVRYHRILHDAAVVDLRVEGDRARLLHSLPAEAGPLPRHAAEFILAGWLVVARQATGLDFAPLEVSFRHAAPVHLAEHRRVFRAPLSFGQPRNEMVVGRTLLDTPLVKSDPGLCAVLEPYVRELLERVPTTTTLAQRVRHLVAEGLPSVATAEVVARRLGRGRRTLNRQLGQEGVSFRSLVDELRHELALRYLAEPRMAVAEVGFLLGFSEASAFHRAFKRWTGITPAEHRRRSEAKGR